MKKKQLNTILVLIGILLLGSIAYFTVQQTALETSIPEGYLPQSIDKRITESGLCSLSSGRYSCVCSNEPTTTIWSGYSSVTYGYDASSMGDSWTQWNAYQVIYTLPNDFPFQTTKETVNGGWGVGTYLTNEIPIGSNIITTNIPTEVNLFEGNINNVKTELCSKQEIPIHLLAWIKRKTSNEYWDLSKDINLKSGCQDITLTLPNNLVVDSYSIVVIPTFIHPAEKTLSASASTGSRCSWYGGTATYTAFKYIQLGNKIDKTVVISSLPPIVYKASAEEQCKEFYVQSLNDPYACITVRASKGCAEVQSDGKIIGCPSAYNPRTEKVVDWVCLASGSCEPPIFVAVGKKLSPEFEETLLKLNKTEADFKLPELPLRKLSFNDPQLDWNKVRGFSVSGLASCMTPNFEGEPLKCSGLQIYLGNTLYATLGVEQCKRININDPSAGFVENQLVPFDYSNMKADGSLVKLGVSVKGCGSATITNTYALQLEECVSNNDCSYTTSAGFNNVGTCTNYKCSYPTDAIPTPKEEETTIIPPVIKDNYLWLVILVIIIILSLLIFYFVKKKR